MMRRLSILAIMLLGAFFTACQEDNVKIADREYILFQDTLSVNPVLSDEGYSFKVPVSSCDHRFSEISCDAQSAFFIINFQKICSHIASVYIINNVFELPVPGCPKLLLPVTLKLKRHLRMGQRQMHEQILHMSCLRHRGL